MIRKSNKIPALIYLIGQFLIDFEKNKNNDRYNLIHKRFIESCNNNCTFSDLSKFEDFDYTNPGFVLMLCYGLIVYPRGLCESMPQEKYKELEKIIIEESKKMNIPIRSIYDLFKQIKPQPNGIIDVVRHLRNSVSHAHVDIRNNRNTSYEFYFWDQPSRNKKINFEATIPITNLSILLTAVGKFYINYARVDMEN